MGSQATTPPAVRLTKFARLGFFNFLDKADGDIPDFLDRGLANTFHRELRPSKNELNLIEGT